MKRKELIDCIDDNLIFEILNSERTIENDCEFVYYYALQKVRILNRYIKSKYHYKNFIIINKNTKFLELRISTITQTKIFTYSGTYSLNKNLNELHISLENFLNHINDEILNAEQVISKNIQFIKKTTEKLKKCQFIDKNEFSIKILRTKRFANIKMFYGNTNLSLSISFFNLKKTELLRQLQSALRDNILMQSTKALEKKEYVAEFELKTLIKILNWYMDKPFVYKISWISRLINSMKDNNIPQLYKDKVIALEIMENIKGGQI